MKITEGLLTKDKQDIILWTNSKGADFISKEASLWKGNIFAIDSYSQKGERKR